MYAMQPIRNLTEAEDDKNPLEAIKEDKYEDMSSLSPSSENIDAILDDIERKYQDDQ